MRVSTVLIIVAAVAGVVFGAARIGHAVDQPAKQLDTVVAMPASAASTAAEANLQPAVSAAASYKIDNGGYSGMTTSGLRSYDRAIAAGVSVKKANAAGYCIQSTVATATASITGPGGTFVARGC
jgi:hypothetical protein